MDTGMQNPWMDTNIIKQNKRMEKREEKDAMIEQLVVCFSRLEKRQGMVALNRLRLQDHSSGPTSVIQGVQG